MSYAWKLLIFYEFLIGLFVHNDQFYGKIIIESVILAGILVSASKHGVVQHNSFSVMISTSLFEALFSSRFQMTLLRQIF